jgi:hypothetical protein
LFVDDPDGGEGGVGHDDTVNDHGTHVHFFGALGTITHGKDKLHSDEEDTGIAKNEKEEFTPAMEGVEFRVGE